MSIKSVFWKCSETYQIVKSSLSEKPKMVDFGIIVQELRHEYIIVRELGICDINGVFSIRVTPDMSDNNMLIAIFNEEYQTSVYILDVKL